MVDLHTPFIARDVATLAMIAGLGFAGLVLETLFMIRGVLFGNVEHGGGQSYLAFHLVSVFAAGAWNLFPLLIGEEARYSTIIIVLLALHSSKSVLAK